MENSMKIVKFDTFESDRKSYIYASAFCILKVIANLYIDVNDNMNVLETIDNTLYLYDGICLSSRIDSICYINIACKFIEKYYYPTVKDKMMHLEMGD